MLEKRYPRCALCPTKVCENWGGRVGDASPSLEKAPAFCPMKLMPEVYGEALAEYDKPSVKDFARLASVQEFQCYEVRSDGRRTKLPRVEELIQFARKCGYKRLGIAHCGGLAHEAGLLTEVLENNGFEVVSVQCKTGAVPKERIGISTEKIAGSDAWGDHVQPHRPGDDYQPLASRYGCNAGVMYRPRHPFYKVLRSTADGTGCQRPGAGAQSAGGALCRKFLLSAAAP